MRACTRAAYGAALFHVLTAGAALACPVAADLDGDGIRFLSDTDIVEVHRRVDADRIAIDFITNGSPDFSRSVVIHGVYVESFVQVRGGVEQPGPGSGLTLRPLEPSEMPRPTAGLVWDTPQTFKEGNTPVEEVMTITVGQPGTWTLGTCTYAMLPVEVSVVSAHGGYQEGINYLPDIGTGVLTRYADADATSNYTYVGIEAVE